MAKRNTYRGTIQSERILTLLRTASGCWVPLPQILELGVAQYSARIYELRRQGHVIENRIDRTGDVCRSWFRLLPGDTRFNPSPKPASPEQPSWEDRPRITGLPLFDMVRR